MRLASHRLTTLLSRPLEARGLHGITNHGMNPSMYIHTKQISGLVLRYSKLIGM
jgi:hypothetical protein